MHFSFGEKLIKNFVFKTKSDKYIRNKNAHISLSQSIDMIFSKSCEYGIRAAIYIAQQSMQDERCSLKDIAKEIGSPEAFTAKILQQLVHGGIIESVKGASGGFMIAKKRIRKIRLMNIKHAIDGESGEKTCVMGLKACSEEHPCPVHHKYKHIKKDILHMLYHTYLLEMSERIIEGISCLKI